MYKKKIYGHTANVWRCYVFNIILDMNIVDVHSCHFECNQWLGAQCQTLIHVTIVKQTIKKEDNSWQQTLNKNGANSADEAQGCNQWIIFCSFFAKPIITIEDIFIPNFYDQPKAKNSMESKKKDRNWKLSEIDGCADE